MVDNGMVLFEGGLCSTESQNRSETLAHQAWPCVVGWFTRQGNPFDFQF